MKDDFDVTKLEKKTNKRINSKQKGGRFERKIADLFNQKFNTKDFCRTPGSGAFATTHSLPEHLKIYGDLITPKNFKYIFELKSGYNKEGICNLFHSNSILSDMIAQVTRDSKKSKKDFLLIIANDRKDPIVIMPDLNVTYYIKMDYHLQGKINGLEVNIIKLEDLLKLPNEFFLSQD